MRKINFDRKLKRKLRVSSNINGTNTKPRISVFKSNKYIYAQAIDDDNKNTLISFSSLVLSKKKDYKKMKKTDEAKIIGELMGKMLKEKGIDKGVFDRGLYAYKGRIAKVAEGLRNNGIKI